MEMQPRLDYGKIVQGVGRAMGGLDQHECARNDTMIKYEQ